MADVVIVTYIPEKNGVPLEQVRFALEKLIQVVHSNIDDVGFKKGNENAEGINAIRIKTKLNQKTKNDLENALQTIFGFTFEISFAGEMQHLNKEQGIRWAIKEIQKQLTSSGTSAPTP